MDNEIISIKFNNSPDAMLSVVKDVKPHPNADRLDIITVKGYQCIVKKGEFAENDIVLFIAPDARLNSNFEWVKTFQPFLGKNNRVKTVKIRGEYSEGIVIPYEKLLSYLKNIDLNDKTNGICPVDIGITHYEIANTGRSALPMRASHLPYGLLPTDQENVQNLEISEILGKMYLVTKKLDGSSCTITFEMDKHQWVQDVHITSRRVDLRFDGDNAFIHTAKPIVDRIRHIFNARSYEGLTEEEIAFKDLFSNASRVYFRGELTGEGINKNRANLDCFGSPKFNLFECIVCSNDSGQHRVNVQSIPLFEHVPILGTVALNEEFIDEVLNWPKENGEGVVLWEIDKAGCLTGMSFKIKSKDYYANI